MSMQAFAPPTEAGRRFQSGPCPADPFPACGNDLRQLRHQTRNALQRLLCIIGSAPELGGQDKAALRDSLQRRIVVAAELSDALFGFRGEPGDLPERLRGLCVGAVELMADDGACIAVSFSSAGSCPPDLHETVVRLAHELVCNAVRHGMYRRAAGAVDVQLRSTETATTLAVIDDGWGCSLSGAERGEGLSMVGLLLQAHDGGFAIERRGGDTVASATIRHTRQAGERKEAADTSFAAAVRGSRRRAEA